MEVFWKQKKDKNLAQFLGLGLFLVLLIGGIYFLINNVLAIGVPQIITYQGKLLINGNSATTTQNIEFVLYDTPTVGTGTALYTASGTLGTPLSVGITPNNGIFSIDLGGTGTNNLSSGIFKNYQNVYLEVTIEGQTLNPRKQITAAPYAFNAEYLNGVGTNTVSSSTYIPVSDAEGNFNFNSVTSTGLLTVKYNNNNILQQWLDNNDIPIASLVSSSEDIYGLTTLNLGNNNDNLGAIVLGNYATGNYSQLLANDIHVISRDGVTSTYAADYLVLGDANGDGRGTFYIDSTYGNVSASGTLDVYGTSTLHQTQWLDNSGNVIGSFVSSGEWGPSLVIGSDLSSGAVILPNKGALGIYGDGIDSNELRTLLVDSQMRLFHSGLGSLLDASGLSLGAAGDINNLNSITFLVDSATGNVSTSGTIQSFIPASTGGAYDYAQKWFDNSGSLIASLSTSTFSTTFPSGFSVPVVSNSMFEVGGTGHAGVVAIKGGGNDGDMGALGIYSPNNNYLSSVYYDNGWEVGSRDGNTTSTFTNELSNDGALTLFTQAGYGNGTFNVDYLGNVSTSGTLDVFGTSTLLGNVGIGTTTPQYALDVNGSIQTNGNLYLSTSTANSGIIYIDNQPALHMNGAGNVFLGKNSGILDSPLLVVKNTAVGDGALQNINSTDREVAIGYQALNADVSGYLNTAVGSSALSSSVDSFGNTAVGAESLTMNNSGNNNTALGVRALYSNQTGYNNVALGVISLYSNDSGRWNLAIGNQSLLSNLSGDNNIAIGESSLGSNTIGSSNLAIGKDAGYISTSSVGNIFLGYQSGYNEIGSNKLYIENSDSASPLIYGEFDNDLVRVNGTFNVTATSTFATTTQTAFQLGTSATPGYVLTTDANGYGTWQAAAGAVNNWSRFGTTYGQLSLMTSSTSPVWFDDNVYASSSLYVSGNTTLATTTASSLTLTGNLYLATSTVNSGMIYMGGNPFVGEYGPIDSGNGSVFLGLSAGSQNILNSVAIGNFTLRQNNGGGNVAVGEGAMNINTGSNNVAIGQGAQWGGSGNYNVGVGSNVLTVAAGDNNVGLGVGALSMNNSGYSNVALGYQAGYFNTVGSRNLFLGYQAGYSESGSDKLYIENSNSVSPLIYGEFDNDLVRVNGTFEVTGTSTFSTTTQTAFQLGTSATAGYVLTANANGYGTWQAAAAGVNDWGRFGTTYGQLSLMTSTTYPVWFDGAVYASSSLITSGNTTLGDSTSTDVVAINAKVGINSSTPSDALTVVGGNILQTASGNPTLKGTDNNLSGFSTGIYVSGKYAYIVDGFNKNLGIVDVTNLNNPTTLSTIDLGSGDTNDVYVSGKYAYVAAGGSGLLVVDISNPKSPVLVATKDTPGSAAGIYVSGKYAYVADYASGLQVIDISSSTAPNIVGTISTSGSAKDIYVSGKYAYVAVDTAGLQIIDISNPTTPTIVGTRDTSGNATGVYVSGKYAYVADYASGLQIIDISNPAAPSAVVGTYNTPGNAYQVYVSGRYAYVADASSLQVIDIFNAAAPTFVGKFDPIGGVYSLYISGKYAYLGEAGYMQVVDINGTETPSLYVGNIATNDLTVTENGDIGNSLYVKNSLNVGLGGILANGSISSMSTTSVNYLANSLGIGTTTPQYSLDVNGKIGLSGIQALYLPNQTNFTGSLIVGNGGGSLSHGSGTQGFYNTFVGLDSGFTNSTGNQNTAVGFEALKYNTTGGANSAFGYQAAIDIGGSSNSAFGSMALYGFGAASGSSNSAFGAGALEWISSGSSNTAVGEQAGLYNQTGNYNVFLGGSVARGNGSAYLGANNNTIIGYQAGYSATNSWSGNVMIGYQAGYNETSSNKLYIENSNSASPLIYGEFDNNLVRINGTFNVTATSSFATTTQTAFQLGTSATPGYVLTADANGYGTWQAAAGGTNNWSRFGTTYGQLSLMTSTTYPVWFDGNVYASSSLYVSGNTTLGDSASTDIVSVNGKVGINTSNPTQSLTIAGGTILQTVSGTPTLKGTCYAGSDVADIFVVGRYAYATLVSTSQLAICDVSNPSSPTLVKLFTFTGYPADLFVSGKYAYVANRLNGLLIIDISNPLSPSLVSTYDTPGSAFGVYVSGRYAYVADAGGGLRILDISNPTSPSLVGTYATSDSTNNVYVVGRYAYVADGANGLRILDISNPASPSLVGTYNTSGLADDVYVSGKYAYVGDGASGLQIINVVNPTSPSLVGTYNTSGSATKVRVAGKYAYVADGLGGFVILDITNPASPSLVYNYTSGVVSETSIFVEGRYAYITDGTSGILVLELNGTDVPTFDTGDMRTNNLTITENGYINNGLYVGTNLNVGIGGIMTDGALSVNSTNTPSYFGGSVNIGGNGNGLAQLFINSSSTDAKPLVIRANANQASTAYLTEWQDSSGSTLAYIASSTISGAAITDFSVGGNNTLALLTLKGSGVAGGNAPMIQLMDPSNSYSRVTLTSMQSIGSYLQIGTGLVTSTFAAGSLRIGQTTVGAYSLGDTGRFYVDAATGNVSASGTLQVYSTSTLWDATLSGTLNVASSTYLATATGTVVIGPNDQSLVCSFCALNVVADSANSRPAYLSLNASSTGMPAGIIINADETGGGIMPPFIMFQNNGESYGTVLASASDTAWGKGLHLIAGTTGSKLYFWTNGSNDRIVVDTTGYVGFGSSTPTYPLSMSSGAHVTVGGTWTNASDKNLKENFTVLDPATILEKIIKLPVTEWNYKSEATTTLHIGPVAQDFYELFGLGGSDVSISTIDPSGVALLGIQALDKKLNDLSTLINSSTLLVAQNNNNQIINTNDSLDMKNNSIFNVLYLAGKNNKWSIDEEGNFVVRYETTAGEKSMYGLQSPQAEFVFSSSSALVDGEAEITFEQDEQDIIDSNSPIKVTVTLTSGEAAGIYVSEKGPTGFKVKELQNGRSNATFDWIVVAKRKSVQDDFIDSASNSGIEEDTTSTLDSIVVEDSSSTPEVVVPEDTSVSIDTPVVEENSPVETPTTTE